MPRYRHADLLRNYERLNTHGGQFWRDAAAKRYQAPRLPARGGPMGDVGGNGAPLSPSDLGLDFESAPQMTHGVDTLMHVGSADGLGFIDLSSSKLLPAAAFGAYGYFKNKDVKDAAIWALGGYISPLLTTALVIAIQMGWIKMPNI